MQQDQARDIATAALGILAAVLGVATVLGVVRPAGGEMAGNVPGLAITGVIVGVAGLYVARSRGSARRVAVIGMAAALVGLAVFGGGLALDVLITDIRGD